MTDRYANIRRTPQLTLQQAQALLVRIQDGSIMSERARQDLDAIHHHLAAVHAQAERYRLLRGADNADGAPFIAQRGAAGGITQWTGEQADTAIDTYHATTKEAGPCP